MDELEISGKRYISSKRAARENKYHIDYVGQLIRAGKIVGSKVGRTWYVEEDSLANYLGKELIETAAAPTPQLVQQKAAVIRTPQTSPEPARKIFPGLTYLSDEEPLVRERSYIEEPAYIPPPQAQVPQFKEEPPVFVEEKEQVVQSRSKFPIGLLIFTSLLAFVLAAGASYLLSYRYTIGKEGESATVYLSFPDNLKR